MGLEYLKPMLDVGSPRVFNCNIMTHRIQAQEPGAEMFFRNKVLNNLVLIKDTVPDDGSRSSAPPIGTKLYFPFNENEIYEGGRTIFVHDKHVQQVLLNQFGEGALKKEALIEDMRILHIMDRLPSLDPFLLKDVFLNEGMTINPAYFEVSQEVWNEIESFILQRFEPLVKAAFPDAKSAEEKGRQLIEKIWEARDLEALKPLTMAFQLPSGQELEIFAAWKGINFYAFQYQRMKTQLVEMLTWLKDLELPHAVPVAERNEVKASLELARTQVRDEWRRAEMILREYQESYDKLFGQKSGGSGSVAGFLTFLKNSKKSYWELGNSLGKVGHASYCWDTMSRRFPDRKLSWDGLKETLQLIVKIFGPAKKLATSVAWK